MFKRRFKDIGDNLYFTRFGAALRQYLWFTGEEIRDGRYKNAAALIFGSPVLFLGCYADTKSRGTFTYVERIDENSPTLDLTD